MWNGDYEDDDNDYDEPSDYEDDPFEDEEDTTCQSCGHPYCERCAACHTCDRDITYWRGFIKRCEQRQRNSIPEELRVSEGL